MPQSEIKQLLVKRLKRIVTPEKADRQRALLQTCSFATIIDFYHFDDCIKTIVAVSREIDFFEVAAMLQPENMDDFNPVLLEELLLAGLLIMVFPEKRINERNGVRALSFVEVGRKTEVSSIYAPPFAIIQIKKEAGK